jgi:tetratricopeptide (TPR) repeat protein
MPRSAALRRPARSAGALVSFGAMFRRAVIGACCWGALAAWSALAGGARAAGAPGGETARPGLARDVVLITIDTWRADAAGFAGNARASTPVLDRLAVRGRVFTGAHAHNVVTLPSHTNILTGLYPFQHGVRDNSGFRLPAAVPTLATVLREAGFATGAFVGAYPLDSTFGLNRGFEVYDDHYPKGSDPEAFAFAERKGDKVVGPALAWWKKESGRRRFLWVHLFDPHAPYDPPEPFASRFAGNPYLGEVAAADAFLGPLLEPFLAGAEPPAVIAVTGDHGEALGEHGELTHGLFAYEATLKVPLVLWGAGVTPGREDRPVRHVDIFPTLLAAAGVTPPAPRAGLARPGRSLLAAVGGAGGGGNGGGGGDGRGGKGGGGAGGSRGGGRGDGKAGEAGGAAGGADGGGGGRAGGEAGEISYFEALSANLNRGWAPLRGVLRAGEKLIALPLPELYDLPRDPREAHNEVAARRGLARELGARLPAGSEWPAAGGAGRAAAADTAAAGGAPNAEERARLQSLGYAAGSAPARRRYGPEDDPKRLVALDQKIHRVIDSYSRGRTQEAVELARQVVAARPGMPLGYSLLTQALLQGGRQAAREEALAVMRRARERGLASPPLLCQLGLTLAQEGRTAEALAVLRPLADRDEPGALDALGLALSDAGRQEEAIAALERQLKQVPDDATAVQELGLIELRRGRWREARERSTRAVELNPRLPLGWNDLGVALYQLGQPEAALDAWQRAVDLDPRLLDALWNLGTKGAEHGRAEAARRALARFLAQAPAERYGADRHQVEALLRQLGGKP